MVEYELLETLKGLKIELLDLLVLIVKSPEKVRVETTGEYHVVYSADDLKVSSQEAFELVKRGLAVNEVIDRVLGCPYCGSRRIHVKFRCPYCNSFNIANTKLVQHTVCGYVDLEIRFYDEIAEVWKCPSCGMKIGAERDLTEVGKIFYCFNCGKTFSRPLLRLICDRCGREASLFEARYDPIYKLKPTEKGKQVVEKAIDMLYAAISLLDEKGVSYQINPVIGKSPAGMELRAALKVGDLCLDFYDVIEPEVALTLANKKAGMEICSRYHVFAREVNVVAEGMLTLSGIDFSSIRLPSELRRKLPAFVTRVEEA